MRVTRLTGTEIVCVLPEDIRETAVSWQKCRRKVDARLGHLSGVCFDVCRLRDFLGQSTLSIEEIARVL